MYSVLFDKRAEKQLKKLDKGIQKRIVSSLEKIRIRPHHFVKSLVGSKYYSLRVGNYRIILDLQNKELIIVVIEISHRKKIYK